MFGKEAVGVYPITAYPPTTYEMKDGRLGGHMGVAIAALESGYVGRVWVVPSYMNPWKPKVGPNTYEQRLAMTVRAIEDLPEKYWDKIYAKDIETRLPLGYSTADLLSYVALMVGGSLPGVLVAGTEYLQINEAGDGYKAFAGWKDEEKLAVAETLFVPRHNFPVDPRKLPDNMRVVGGEPMNGLEGCSSDARRNIKDLRRYVSPSVFAFIEEHPELELGILR